MGIRRMVPLLLALLLALPCCAAAEGAAPRSVGQARDLRLLTGPFSPFRNAPEPTPPPTAVPEVFMGSEDYVRNKLLLTVNGQRYELDYDGSLRYAENRLSADVSSLEAQRMLMGTTFVFTAPAGPYPLVIVTLPSMGNIQVNSIYAAMRNDLNCCSFILFDSRLRLGGGDGQKLTAAPLVRIQSFINGSQDIDSSPRNTWEGLDSEADLFTIQPVFVSRSSFAAAFFGSFCKGTLQVQGTFWTEP